MQHQKPRSGSRKFFLEKLVADAAGSLQRETVESLGQDLDISIAIHIWMSRKLLGVNIPDGARQFPEEPE